MNNILIIGAGRSSGALINYVLAKAKENNWFVTVADANPALATQKVNNHPNGRGAWLDVMKVNDRREMVSRTDVVVSLLPPTMHLELALDCIKLKKHLITASYVSRELYRLSDEARDRSLIFMGEMGLDPGIDHMSAMQKIDEIKAKGGKLRAFRSYTGGLVAPESDNNPWHYKITWNPRNVVLAGQGTAQFLEDGKFKFIPYNRLFKEYRTVHIEGAGEYEMYANRDSLLYREVYHLKDIPTILRGTLRHKGFCEAWDAIRRIGLTDSSYPILGSENLTYHELMEGYAGRKYGHGSVKERVANMVGCAIQSDVIEKLEWLGLFRKKKINIPNATPAAILENLLIEKWKLQPEEKDMILMQHEFEYELNGKYKRLTTTLTMKGNNAQDTAMAQLVGLPMGIFLNQIMLGNIKTTGVNIPVLKEVYEPVLKELETFGVIFKEKEEEF
jgi:saccharopine dehydrogenase-like NADP-dependent oxidoreductase